MKLHINNKIGIKIAKWFLPENALNHRMAKSEGCCCKRIEYAWVSLNKNISSDIKCEIKVKLTNQINI